jgi:hypothetical protein
MNTTKTRCPYDAKHVAIVDMGGTVWALYIPDAEQAKNPRAVAENITSREYDDVEVVACAQRYYKRDGAIVPGWVITSGPDYSEPIPNKRDMLRGLREQAIPGYFDRPTENNTTNTEEPKMPAATTIDFKPGQRIVVADGTIQTVVKMADRIGSEPQRVEVEGGLQWLASESEPFTGCLSHRIADERGKFAGDLPVPACESGVSYGIWNEDDGGFVHTQDCALQAANDAAEFLAEDTDSEYKVLAVCREHQDEPADTCAECFAEDEDN